MNKIIIKTVPHKDHRYETVGDWYRIATGELVIEVSAELSPKEVLLVAIHELIEVSLCEDRGISIESVEDFDKEFEAKRQPGNTEEPGDQPEAPYHKEHVFSECIERLMARELNVNWDQYTKHVTDL